MYVIIYRQGQQYSQTEVMTMSKKTMDFVKLAKETNAIEELEKQDSYYEEMETKITNELKNLDGWCLKQVYRFILNIQRED